MTSGTGVAPIGVASLLALVCASEAATGSTAFSWTPAWVAASLIGMYAATRSHLRLGLVVLVAAALGITALHAQYVFLAPEGDFAFDPYYVPMLAAFWAGVLAALVGVGSDGSDLPRVLAAAFVGLLVLGLVIDPGPSEVPLDVRLAVGVLVAAPLGAGVGLAPGRTLVAGLVALAAAALVEAATDIAEPGFVGVDDVVPVGMPLIVLGGMFVMMRHVGGEETRRVT